MFARLHAMLLVLIGAAMVFVFAPYSFIEGSARLQNAESLLARGQQTTGQVLEISGRRSTRTIQFKFEVDGKSIVGESSMGREEAKRYRLGQQVSITYLPDNPSVSHLDPEDMRESGRALRVAGPILGLALGAFMGGIGIYRLRRQSVGKA